MMSVAPDSRTDLESMLLTTVPSAPSSVLPELPFPLLITQVSTFLRVRSLGLSSSYIAAPLVDHQQIRNVYVEASYS